jgi:hypothetical protein
MTAKSPQKNQLSFLLCLWGKALTGFASTTNLIRHDDV